MAQPVGFRISPASSPARQQAVCAGAVLSGCRPSRVGTARDDPHGPTIDCPRAPHAALRRGRRPPRRFPNSAAGTLRRLPWGHQPVRPPRGLRPAAPLPLPLLPSVLPGTQPIAQRTKVLLPCGRRAGWGRLLLQPGGHRGPCLRHHRCGQPAGQGYDAFPVHGAVFACSCQAAGQPSDPRSGHPVRPGRTELCPMPIQTPYAAFRRGRPPARDAHGPPGGMTRGLRPLHRRTRWIHDAGEGRPSRNPATTRSLPPADL